MDCIVRGVKKSGTRLSHFPFHFLSLDHRRWSRAPRLCDAVAPGPQSRERRWWATQGHSQALEMGGRACPGLSD